MIKLRICIIGSGQAVNLPLEAGFSISSQLVHVSLLRWAELDNLCSGQVASCSFLRCLEEQSNRFANVKTVLFHRPTVVSLSLASAFEPLRLLLHVCPGHPQGQSPHWGIVAHTDWKIHSGSD